MRAAWVVVAAAVELCPAPGGPHPCDCILEVGELASRLAVYMCRPSGTLTLNLNHAYVLRCKLTLSSVLTTSMLAG